MIGQHGYISESFQQFTLQLFLVGLCINTRTVLTNSTAVTEVRPVCRRNDFHQNLRQEEYASDHVFGQGTTRAAYLRHCGSRGIRFLKSRNFIGYWCPDVEMYLYAKFVKIGQSVAKLLRFFYFSRWRPSAILDSFRANFDHPQ